jgi:hypothetical protein
MVMSSAGLRPENDYAGETSSNNKRKTRHLVKKGAALQETRNCLTVTKMLGPRWGLTPRQAGQLAIGRNIILTLTLNLDSCHDELFANQPPSS